MRIAGTAIIFTLLFAGAGQARSIAHAGALPPAPRFGFRAEFLADLSDMEKKVLSLAGALPAERYEWRPAPGVRSVGEVFMHIAGGNYMLVTFIGAQTPAGEDEQTLAQINTKPRILDELRKSFEHLRQAALTTSDRELDRPVRMFGSATTKRGALMMALTHVHEHLGQSVAYARMIGIVPPWSQTQ